MSGSDKWSNFEWSCLAKENENVEISWQSNIYMIELEFYEQ